MHEQIEKAPAEELVELILSGELHAANQKFNSIVEAKDLPFHCPPKGTTKWNMHPKVYIKFNKNNKGFCPYCGASYELG